MTWIPVPSEPLAGGRRLLPEGYAACPETGEIRSPAGNVLHARRAGPRALSIHVWALAPGGERVRTSASPARCVALALLALGFVEAPNAKTHARRAAMIVPTEPPRASNLAWQGRRGSPPDPLRITAAGRAALGGAA